jgi:RNA polymerase sigma-70 factor (ECF subfamily)
VTIAIEERTNDQWLADLSGEGASSAEALEQLREYLLRAILVYLTRHRSDLSRYDFDDLRQMAEDWAQAAVVQVIEKRHTFRGASKFTTWAYRVAINLAATDLRRRTWDHASLEELVEDRSPALTQALEESATTPEQAATRRQIWSAVQSVIEEDLSERQRQSLTMAVLGGAPIEVVAEALDTNRNNVYKIIHDARRKLRAALQDRGWTPDDVMRAFATGSDS